MYAGIDVHLFKSLAGTAETLSVLPVVALLALALVGSLTSSSIPHAFTAPTRPPR